MIDLYDSGWQEETCGNQTELIRNQQVRGSIPRVGSISNVLDDRQAPGACLGETRFSSPESWLLLPVDG